MPLLSEGDHIHNTYTVERMIGAGAFAEVYRVNHRFLGRQAMKVFKAVGVTIEELNEALAEAKLLSRIGHPNIIRVFDANVYDSPAGRLGYFTMEHVGGGTLMQFRRTFGGAPVPVPMTVDVISQVCQGLTVAHRNSPPIVHRDVKPQNILIGYGPGRIQVRLSDFGLAKRVNPLTLKASARGTLFFLPPEIHRNTSADARKGDVWAVGLCLYWLLTDRFPYLSEDDPDETLPGEGRTSWRPPSDFNCLVPADIDHIAEKALALDPDKRYSDAGEILADLEACSCCGKPRSGNEGVLGFDGETARALAQRAVRLARDSGRLSEAASLLDRALKLAPELRDDYGVWLDLWSKGVAQ